MLVSLLYRFTALEPIMILGPLGRPAQAWFLGLLRQADGKLAAEMHESKALHPYTVSSLLDDRGYTLRANRRIEQGQGAWLRVTAFRSDFCDMLLGKVSRALPGRVELYKMPFRLDGCTDNRFEHPLAGRTDWQEFCDLPAETLSKREARVEFLSPTAFRDEGKDLPLPLPGSVFRSLYERWNAFCPEAMQIDPSWPEFASDCVVVSELTAVNSTRWVFAEGTRGAATGFTGTVGFTLVSYRQAREWDGQWQGAASVLQSLARFAFFSGVGHHTAIGMGQARLLS